MTHRRDAITEVGSHREFLVRLATAMLKGNASLADDIVQEALLVAVKKPDRIPESPLVLPWLIGVLKNKFMKSLRRTANTTFPLAAELPDARNVEMDVESVKNDRLAVVLSQLPPSHQRFWHAKLEELYFDASSDIPSGPMVRRMRQLAKTVLDERRQTARVLCDAFNSIGLPRNVTEEIVYGLYHKTLEYISELKPRDRKEVRRLLEKVSAAVAKREPYFDRQISDSQIVFELIENSLLIINTLSELVTLGGKIWGRNHGLSLLEVVPTMWKNIMINAFNQEFAGILPAPHPPAEFPQRPTAYASERHEDRASIVESITFDLE